MILVALNLFQVLPLTRERVDQVTIKPDTRIEVNNANGDVVIRGWDQDYVEIRSTMTTERDTLEFDKVAVVVKQGSPLVIETDYKDNNVDVSVDYEIRVPDRAGKVELNVVNGGIVMKDVSVEAKASAVNGRIDLDGIKGPVYADCVNGEIRIVNSADIRKVSNVSGDIEAGIDALNHEGVMLNTVSGAIRITVNPKLNATVHMASISGEMSVRDIELRDREAGWSASRGRLNQGGPLISASSVSGSIILTAGR
jgi:DUF4097 and DUF4098 domain-containing protein YvlB